MEICNNCGLIIQEESKTINDLIVCEACFLILENKSTGLGDTIAKFTHATGLDVVAKEVANSLGFEDCGCDERRRILNEKFPYLHRPFTFKK